MLQLMLQPRIKNITEDAQHVWTPQQCRSCDHNIASPWILNSECSGWSSQVRWPLIGNYTGAVTQTHPASHCDDKNRRKWKSHKHLENKVTEDKHVRAGKRRRRRGEKEVRWWTFGTRLERERRKLEEWERRRRRAEKGSWRRRWRRAEWIRWRRRWRRAEETERWKRWGEEVGWRSQRRSGRRMKSWEEEIQKETEEKSWKEEMEEEWVEEMEEELGGEDRRDWGGGRKSKRRIAEKVDAGHWGAGRRRWKRRAEGADTGALKGGGGGDEGKGRGEL